jgi:hypothetical protein
MIDANGRSFDLFRSVRQPQKQYGDAAPATAAGIPKSALIAFLAREKEARLNCGHYYWCGQLPCGPHLPANGTD